MIQFNEEASPIARLIGPDGKRTVGWVYAWQTSELSILWIEDRESAKFIDPVLCPEILAKANATTPPEVIVFLTMLPKTGP